MHPENTCELGSITFDVHADDHIDPPFSHVWCWGLVGVLLIFIVRCLIYRAGSLRQAREADAAFDEHAQLVAGSRFISGRVEFAEGSTSAVMVHVEQTGSETKNKNSWSHRWTEWNRTVHAAPFYVRRANGERIRVEPGKDPLLVDDPDRVIWKSREARTRIAALTPNEPVIVEGVLTRGHDPESQQAADYRSTAHGWIMVPARGERMHLSTEKLGDRHRKRAHGFSKALVILMACLGFVSLLFVTYEIRLLYGEDTCAEVTRKEVRTSRDSKGRTTNHYEVNLRVAGPGQPVLTRELDRSDWNQVTYGDILAFLHVPIFKSASSPGSGASAHVASIIFAIIAALVGIVTFVMNRNHRRWYEGKLEDRRPGRLPDHPPGTQGLAM